MDARLRYSVSDAFETFPRPIHFDDELHSLGVELDALRKDTMSNLNVSLTRLYQSVDRDGAGGDVEGLRDCHLRIDRAVARSARHFA